MHYPQALFPIEKSRHLERANALIRGSPVASSLVCLGVGFALGVASQAALGDALAKYESVEEIPARRFRQQHTIAARVERVTDGDTIRAMHLALRGAAAKPLAVRLYAVDAPETAKFGKPGQPLGREATAFVAAKLQGRRVGLKLLRRDQYGRAVARVTYRKYVVLKGDIAADLVDAGLARLYRSSGAEYDGRKPDFERREARAKVLAKGIWSLDDTKNDPAAFKRHLKQQQQQQNAPPGFL